ncbi:MAG TPA: DNA methyltransferase [Acidimicrobiia bacterium]
MEQVPQEFEPAVDVTELHAWPANPNLGDVGAIVQSIDTSGFYGAVLAQKGTGRIIAGHHRLKAAVERGADTLPVLWLDVDDETADRIAIGDNQTTRLGHWNDEGLAELLTDLAGTDLGLAGTGFDGDDLDQLLADLDDDATGGRSDIEDDEPPEPPDDPVSKHGDLWVCGEHRVLCADAMNHESYERLLGDARVDLTLTDPPYGVNVDYGDGFEDSPEGVRGLVEAFIPHVLDRSEAVLITSGRTVQWDYPRPTWVLVWAEPAGVGRGPWGFTCSQLILAYGKDPYLKAGLGSRPDSYFGTGEGPSSDEHPVAKPMKVWCWLLERGTIEKGQSVLDPFLGSGTTLVAAQHLGRVCYGVELAPRFTDVAVRRWQNLTGEQATHAESGEVFPIPPEPST